MYTALTAIIVIGVALFLFLLVLRRWRNAEQPLTCMSTCDPQLVHRLCPHDNVVQGFQVEQKDSLDDHLDSLTRKLAEKEGRLRLSKSKIRETQNEIDNLHQIDQNVKLKYQEVMDSLRTDLLGNEKECKKLQEQIEWISHRRAELRDDVRRSQLQYGKAAAELAENLAKLQRSKFGNQKIVEKPHAEYTECIIRHRKEPKLPNMQGAGSIIIKTPPLKLSHAHVSQVAVHHMQQI